MVKCKKWLLILVLALAAVLAACSNSGQSDSAKMSGGADQNKSDRDYGDSVGRTGI